MTADAKIKELGIALPEPKPVGNYVPGVVVGNLLYLSGQGPDARRESPPSGARSAGTSPSTRPTRSPARSGSTCSARRDTSSAASTA